MSRSALPRCIAVFVLVLCLISLAPAWASGKARPPVPSTPAPGVSQQAGVLASLWSWLEALAGKSAGEGGGHHMVIDKGCSIDPNGHCS
ncbi:MAG TPA: hypothetical protein VMW75_06090 [Thermoanaerobaculia bacterium]|nr:hypothetical protein [Thermoanaerobaculia bacterium]